MWTKIRQRFVLTLLVCCLSDVALKYWLQHILGMGEIWKLWPGVFQLQLVQNHGAAFSLLANQPELLQWCSAIGVSILTGICWQKQAQPAIAFGMIAGGALGNVLDRLRYGAVWDYLDVVAIHYPIFNLADACICLGVAGLVWSMVTASRQ